MTESPDEYCAAEVRRQDPDRWLTALFAPDVRRPALLALYAFNAEIARAREAVSQPMIGQIRLQWWREAWEGITQDRPRQHPVVLALHSHCRQANPADVAALIDARERDMEPAPMADMAALLDYAEKTSAPLMRLAAAALGVPVSDDLQAMIRPAATAYALAGLLRATSFMATQERVVLPADLLAAQGMRPEDLYQQGSGTPVFSVIAAVAAEAESLLQEAGRQRISRAAIPAVLPARLGRVYLRALRRAGHDPDAPAAAVSATRKHAALLVASVTRRI
ncbi:phytoene/squalene synthase family protein [Ferrovibrio xuzhouensis]|uniref:Phytoene/squalene synthase family protein n=1 Tax=Ferrovibrio xuzhouensis TaxID=1576914 RepID=A0ABV7VJK7_9PROT